MVKISDGKYKVGDSANIIFMRVCMNDIFSLCCLLVVDHSSSRRCCIFWNIVKWPTTLPYKPDWHPGLRFRSHKKLEVFGWSPIPKNTRSPVESFLHYTNGNRGTLHKLFQ